jgi:starch synthase
MDKMAYELRDKANFAFLGSGEKKYNDYFEGIKGKYPNIFVKVGYDEPLSRKMYAAADFLLMPSIFEPCGLNQMIAMRYGTLVVARKTGGLADTVKDISEPNGYGILFENPDKFQFGDAIDRAVELYKDSVKFSKLCELVSTLDFSWEASAAKYIRLYESLKFG